MRIGRVEFRLKSRESVMKQWEYKTVSVSGSSGDLALGEPLNGLGADGWELVSAIHHGQVTHRTFKTDLVLKRPKQATVQPE
jgi:hypothetical protein